MKSTIIKSIIIINFISQQLHTCTNPDFKEVTQSSYNVTAAEYTKNIERIDSDSKAILFLQHIKPGSHILDLGCGPGKDAKYFVEQGFKVTGIDFSTSMIKIARQHAPDAIFHTMDIEQINFSDGEFDAIWAAASLLHIPKNKLPNILYKLKSLLKEKG